MIIVPELQTVVVLTPRTGTRSLKNALLTTYPEAFMLYRHMEADGVPQGYDRWRKVGIVREPVDRLWSLYKYLERFGLDWCAEHDETYTASMRRSVEQPFEQWLLTNDLPFTTPYDSAGFGRFFPAYACRHPLPENRKSQFVYLRPDLGTLIWNYDQSSALHRDLGIGGIIGRQNGTSDDPPPPLSEAARDYVQRWFSWDCAQVSA
jgi:hypothetical protein